jgi:hypothetical protein
VDQRDITGGPRRLATFGLWSCLEASGLGVSAPGGRVGDLGGWLAIQCPAFTRDACLRRPAGPMSGGARRPAGGATMPPLWQRPILDVTIWQDEYHFAVWCWCGHASLCLFDARTEEFLLAGGAVTCRGHRVCFECAASLAATPSRPEQYGGVWAEGWTEDEYKYWVPWLPTYPRTLDVVGEGLTHVRRLGPRCMPYEMRALRWTMPGAQPAALAATASGPTAPPGWGQGARPVVVPPAVVPQAVVPQGCRQAQGSQPAAPATPPVPTQAAGPPWAVRPAVPAAPAALALPAPAAEPLREELTPDERIRELEQRVAELAVRVLLLEHRAAQPP